MSLFKNKTLMITGGTGSFGNAVLNRFLRTDIGEIRIFSRDEKKQDDMRHEFQVKMPEVADKIGNEILEIVRKAYYNDNSKNVTSAGYNIAENIMMYIDSNFTRKFTIEDITNTFYMCKTQLIKHFKKHYRITPMKYVQEKRIEASKHYLKSTDIPITSIYSSVGFSDAKYFSLAFKKHTGMSPKEYRRAFAEKN